MKIAARRRFAAGTIVTIGAVLATFLVTSDASAGNASVTPNFARNDAASQSLTFSTDSDYTGGGSGTFTHVASASSTVDITINPPQPNGKKPVGTANFADGGDYVGVDGPADAGTYNLSLTSNDPFQPPTASGGGTDTCTSCFTVVRLGNLAVTSANPNAINQNSSGNNITVTGNNFERNSRIDVLFPDGTVDTSVQANGQPKDSSGTDITDVTTQTTLLRAFSATAATPTGPRGLRVTNLDGTSASCSSCFTINGAPLTKVSPTAGSNDPNRNPVLTSLTFSGSALATGTPKLQYVGDAGSATKTDLTITGTNAVFSADRTSVMADFDLRNAAPGASAYQPVIVSAADGSQNACSCRFSVVQPSPATVSALSPNSQQAGTTQTVHVTGTNFSKGVRINVSGTGVTTTAVAFLSPTQVDATFSIANGAAAGARDVTATTTDGIVSAVCTGCYTITPGASPSATPTSTVSPSATSSPTVSPSATNSPRPSSSASASASPATFSGFTRIAGPDRYGTAAQLAVGSFPSGATNAIVANGESDNPNTAANEGHFPDALAGAYLAGNKTAPTLLTTRDTLPKATTDALSALNVKNVTILGGTSAVSTAVQQRLQQLGYTVDRVSGTTRYDTAAAVAEKPGAAYVGTDPNNDRTAVLANGQNFPDALAAGPLGYKSRFPIMITTPDTLPSQTRRALTDLNIKHVLITGGTTAVSTTVEGQLTAMGITSQRFAGSTRMDTAAKAAAYEYDSLHYPDTHVNLANGGNFPDALAGGPHAGTDVAPILLTNTPSVLGSATEDFLKSRAGRLEDGHVFGGTAAVTQGAEDQAARDATASSSASPTPSASASASATPSRTPTATASGSASPSACFDPTGITC